MNSPWPSENVILEDPHAGVVVVVEPYCGNVRLNLWVRNESLSGLFSVESARKIARALSDAAATHDPLGDWA